MWASVLRRARARHRPMWLPANPGSTLDLRRARRSRQPNALRCQISCQIKRAWIAIVAWQPQLCRQPQPLAVGVDRQGRLSAALLSCRFIGFPAIDGEPDAHVRITDAFPGRQLLDSTSTDSCFPPYGLSCTKPSRITYPVTVTSLLRSQTHASREAWCVLRQTPGGIKLHWRRGQSGREDMPIARCVSIESGIP